MRTIVLFFLLPFISYSQDDDNRTSFRVCPGDSIFKIGDTLFTACFADKYSMPVCDFKCDYLDSAINKISLIKNAYLDIYIIREFIEYLDENSKRNKDFEMGYFGWDFNRARFVKKYLQCKEISLPVYCHVISIESKKKFQKRVFFPKEKYPNQFVFIVIRDSSVISVSDSLFKKDIDILPYIKYDSLSGRLQFSSTEIMGEIGNYLLDNPNKKAVISLKANVMENDSIFAPLVVSFRKSFLMPFGLIGLRPESIELSILWSTKKIFIKNNKLIESLLLKIKEK